mmetsp:Transcript_33242/g.67986  ORF Transcript_33242/g.67986 Transcript_33242/m.67986 type:complete len:305 (+) Transcript_33242:1423-2337(+)
MHRLLGNLLDPFSRGTSTWFGVLVVLGVACLGDGGHDVGGELLVGCDARVLVDGPRRPVGVARSPGRLDVVEAGGVDYDGPRHRGGVRSSGDESPRCSHGLPKHPVIQNRHCLGERGSSCVPLRSQTSSPSSGGTDGGPRTMSQTRHLVGGVTVVSLDVAVGDHVHVCVGCAGDLALDPRHLDTPVCFRHGATLYPGSRPHGVHRLLGQEQHHRHRDPPRRGLFGVLLQPHHLLVASGSAAAPRAVVKLVEAAPVGRSLHRLPAKSALFLQVGGERADAGYHPLNDHESVNGFRAKVPELEQDV